MSYRKQQILQATAARIREAYCTARDHWHLTHEGRVVRWGATPVIRYDGGTDGDGKTYKNAWLKAAEFVYVNRMNPERFVRSLFNRTGTKVPPPTHLIRADAKIRYEALFPSESGDIVRAFQQQKESCRVEMYKISYLKSACGKTDDDILEAVLANCTTCLSALFRFCLARDRGLVEVERAFFQEALEQYIAQAEVYDVVWAHWLPADFKNLALELTRGSFSSESDGDGSTLDEDEFAEITQTSRRSIIID